MDICYEMYTCTCSKWTFVTKVTRRKECVLVTKRTRRKHCTFITKCIRFEKKFFWTKRSFCKNANSSLTDTVTLAMIHVIMVKTVTIADTNGMIAKADINSHLAKIRNSITSGIKNVTASFYTTQKGRFAAFLHLLKVTYICKLFHFTNTLFKFYYAQTGTMHKWIIPHIFYFHSREMPYK